VAGSWRHNKALKISDESSGTSDDLFWEKLKGPPRLDSPKEESISYDLFLSAPRDHPDQSTAKRQ
jgi:hypothetical protein